MDTLSPDWKVKDVIHTMIDAAAERKKKVDPKVITDSKRAGELLDQVIRRKAVSDPKKYARIRQAFEQNYAKLNSH